MASIGNIWANIGVNTQGLRRGLGDATKQFSNFSNTSVSKIAKVTAALTSMKGLLLTGAIGGGLTLGLKKLTSGIIEASASFEQMELQLNTLTGGKGKETLETLNKWALEMPVNTEQAVKAFVRMKAFGLEPTLKSMETLTDVAVIFGDDALRGVSLALGQMQALGKVSAQDLNQLANVGVNARQIIKETFGLTVEELQKSEIEMDRVMEALMKGMKEKFGGAAKAGMTSWQGLTSVFKSYIFEIQRQIGNAGVFDMLKDHLTKINTGLGDWIKNNGLLLKQKVAEWVENLNKVLSLLIGLVDGLKLVWDVLKGIYYVIRLPFDVSNSWIDKLFATLKAITPAAKQARAELEHMQKLNGSTPRASLSSNKKPTLSLFDVFQGKEQVEFENRMEGLGEETKKTEESFKELDKEIKHKGVDLKEMADIGNDSFNKMRDAVMGWGSQFSSTLTDVLFGAELSFKNIGNSFAKMISQMIIQTQVVEPILAGILGGGNSNTNFGITSVTSGLGSGGTRKGLFGLGGKFGIFGDGGIVTSPTMGMIGERGQPEGILPLTRVGGQLGVRTSGGDSSPTVIVNIENKTENEIESSSVQIQKSPGKVLAEILLTQKRKSRNFRDSF